jgi:alkanesulfonate monooxygenase SsuD/methylene tetrahydromethanopterin reductase-like flavin-dependent oxidoreductase (luciferase family)
LEIATRILRHIRSAATGWTRHDGKLTQFPDPLTRPVPPKRPLIAVVPPQSQRRTASRSLAIVVGL